MNRNRDLRFGFQRFNLIDIIRQSKSTALEAVLLSIRFGDPNRISLVRGQNLRHGMHATRTEARIINLLEVNICVIYEIRDKIQEKFIGKIICIVLNKTEMGKVVTGKLFQ